MRAVLLIIAVSWVGGPAHATPPHGRAAALRAEPLPAPFPALRALHQPKRPPGPGDWLAEHEEAGQSLSEFTRGRDRSTSGSRDTIYVQPLGALSPHARRVVAHTSRFLELFFCAPVVQLRALPLTGLPRGAERGQGETRQVLTRYIVGALLKPRRPPDALAYIALTTTDLWPGKDWNFVYGEAWEAEGLGVWSMHRNGPRHTPEARRQFLRRTVSTAAHEVGHLLGVAHCVAYECLMNGINHREEADAAPLRLCPADLAKLSWSAQCAPRERLARVAAFLRERGLDRDADAFDVAADALR
jgi:archaemetzincin